MASIRTALKQLQKNTSQLTSAATSFSRTTTVAAATAAAIAHMPLPADAAAVSSSNNFSAMKQRVKELRMNFSIGNKKPQRFNAQAVADAQPLKAQQIANDIEAKQQRLKQLKSGEPEEQVRRPFGPRSYQVRQEEAAKAAAAIASEVAMNVVRRDRRAGELSRGRAAATSNINTNIPYRMAFNRTLAKAA